ncbi:MAG TPA: hypothetical protein VJP80_06565 [Candidatus Saccharimonadales bacterium]|nr:hypothetical protein [Candidatus Saccharimonadales bacterium]
MGERYPYGGASVTEGLLIGSFAVALGATIVALAVGASSESYREQGTVHIGADGKPYVLPDGAERPVYSSMQACVDDVTAQMQKIQKDTKAAVAEKPTDLCQPVSHYVPMRYPYNYVYGPIVNRNSAWKSTNVQTWETGIPDRTFNAPDLAKEPGIEAAPVGKLPGSHVEITEPEHGGFGEHGSGGFSKPGTGVVEPHFGGGAGEEGGGFHGGFHGGGAR